MSSTIHQVTDFLSNKPDQIVNAATEIGRSELKKKVFHAIYKGKKKIKTVQDIADATGLKRVAVLNAAKSLVPRLIHQTKHEGDTAYTKNPDFQGKVWKKILKIAGNPKKIAEIPTKVSPASTGKTVTIKIPRAQAKIKLITIDEVDSFAKVHKIKSANPSQAKIPETKFKHGILHILGERGTAAFERKDRRKMKSKQKANKPYPNKDAEQLEEVIRLLQLVAALELCRMGVKQQQIAKSLKIATATVNGMLKGVQKT